MKADREKALATRYGKIEEDLNRQSKDLKPIPTGSIVQVQNQKGKDPLRWDRSGVVVEDLGNQQYTVRMDGSGRVTLRNRRFLRKIEPVIPRYTSVDEVIEKHRNYKADIPNRDMEIPSVGDEGIDDAEEKNRQVEVIEPCRSNREIKPPERFQSKW